MRSNHLADGVQVAFPMWAMPGTVFGLGFAVKNKLQPDDPQAALGEYHWAAWQAHIAGWRLKQISPDSA